MEEVWKDIKGFEGLYQISNLGNLRNTSSGRVRKETDKNGWYFTVNLYDSDHKRHTKRLHRIVAEHFIGDIPKGYHVHHKDGNKQNNCVDNLEILHPKQHAEETVLMNPECIKGMNDYNKYVRPKHIVQYDKEGNFIAEYANSMIASSYTGVCARNILQVASNQEGRKQAGGYVWKFSEQKGVVL